MPPNLKTGKCHEGKWINKLWYLHPLEYYSGIKSNNVDKSQKHNTEQMNPGTK